MSMVCLSRSLSADRELKADFIVAWTGDRKIPETEKKRKTSDTELSWKLSYHIEANTCKKTQHLFLSMAKRSFWQTCADSLLLASLQKSSCRRDTSVGESGDSGQTSWVLDSEVERLGLEA